MSQSKTGSPLGASLADALPRPPEGLEPIDRIKRRWPTYIGALLTLAMIVGLGRELFGHGLAGLSRAAPDSAGYYLCVALLYMSPPTGDFVIFRRLWRIPIDGMAALLKKRIANEVVFGYSGEAYFYAWARQRAQMVAAPFGAVKDVSILSALAGNVMTLAMVGLALALGIHRLTGEQLHQILWSVPVILAITVPFLIFSKRVFSLPRDTLWWVFGVHCARLIAGSLLISLAWHFALPAVTLGTWMFLAAMRMLVSRLPLVPNKDLLFANFAILLIGEDAALSELIAFTSAITLLLHVVLIAGFGAYAWVKRQK